MALFPGICTALTTQVVETLKAGGINTVTDFITVDTEKLSRDFKLPYNDVCSIRQVLLAENFAFPVSGATLYQEALSTLSILPTRCESFDSLLDGGFYTGELTELAGDSACGKTRLCIQNVAATVAIADQTALYIDTCGTFDVQALTQALFQFQAVAEEHRSESRMKHLLQQVHVVQAFDLFELFAALHSLRDKLQLKNQIPFFQNLKLIVLDNVASVVNPIMGKDFTYSQGMVSQLGFRLKEIASTFSVAILITNKMVSSFGGRERKAALGRVWSHIPHTRIMLHRVDDKHLASKGMRRAVLVKSGRQEKFAYFIELIFQHLPSVLSTLPLSRMALVVMFRDIYIYGVLWKLGNCSPKIAITEAQWFGHIQHAAVQQVERKRREVYLGPVIDYPTIKALPYTDGL